MKIHRITRNIYWTAQRRFKLEYENKKNILAPGGAYYIYIGFIMIAFDY